MLQSRRMKQCKVKMLKSKCRKFVHQYSTQVDVLHCIYKSKLQVQMYVHKLARTHR